MHPRHDDSEDIDVTSEEDRQDDLIFSGRFLLAIWAAARDRSIAENPGELYDAVLRHYDIHEYELQALWAAAHNKLIARNAAEFRDIFANGLIGGTQYVISHEPSNREYLFLTARIGKYNEFVTRFNWNFVDINAVFEGQTFLHALIEKDNFCGINIPGLSQGLAQIANFVLLKGASMDIPGRVGDEQHVTVRELLHRWQDNNASTWANSFYFTLFDKPTRGDKVLPVVQAYVARQQAAVHMTNDGVEAERPDKHARFGM